MAYRPHGHEPDDADIARLGYRAFPPKGRPLREGINWRAGHDPASRVDADTYRRAARDLAPGDDGIEYGDVAARIADEWHQAVADYYTAWYAMLAGEEDDQ